MNHTLHYRASVLLTLLAIGLYMTMSQPLMTALGIPYVATTGNFIYKLHPGTYMLLAAALFGMIASGNPIAAAIVSTRDYLSLVMHLAGMMLLFGYSVARYGLSGSAFMIETFVMPAIVVLTMVNFRASERRLVYRFIIALLALNACIGIVESVTRLRLVPYTLADGVAVSEAFFRSTGLLGHPLTNALITSSLLFTTLDLRSALPKTLLVALFMISLLVFGGRAGFVTALLALGAYLFMKAFVGAAKGRFSYTQMLGGLLIAMLVAALFAGFVATSGFGERIFARLYLDDSAEVRLQNWQAFQYMTPGEIVFGVAPQDIFHVMARLGLQYPFETIENPWIFMSLQFGVFGLVVLVLSLASACWWFYERTAAGGRLTLLVFFTVASTYNSLASKSCALTLLFAALTGLTGYAASARKAQAYRTVRTDFSRMEPKA